MNIKLPVFYGIPQWAIYAAMAAGAFIVLVLLAFLIALFVSKTKHKEVAATKESKEPKEPKAPKAKKEKKPKAEKEKKVKGGKKAQASAAASQPGPDVVHSEPLPNAEAETEPKTEPETPALPDDEQLSDVADIISKERGVYSVKKGEKNIKGRKGKAPNPRKSQKQLKERSSKLKVPRTVADTIPYFAVYPDNGIIETKPHVFTKSYLLQDINYQIAKDEEQFDMFMKFGQLLNSFDPTVNVEITINQKNINMEDFEAQTMLPLQDDALDPLRIERNEMMRKKISEGKNSLVKEKYLTVSVTADTLDDAERTFVRLDRDIASHVKKIGKSDATPLTTVQRLETLHDIYNIGSESLFGNNMVMEKKEDGTVEYSFAPEKFRFDIMSRMGLTTKDVIGPSEFMFKSDYGTVGDSYFRALYIRQMPTFLTDKVLDNLTNTECNMITSLHYEPVDGEKSQKMIRNKMTNLNASMVDKQKKATKAGYSPDLISPELKKAQEETDQLLDDINSKNQKIFFVTLVIVHFAATKEQLDSDTKAIQAIGKTMVLDIKPLKSQQENGLNSALPLAYNQLAIKRTLTTESASIFMPFVNQELQDRKGGMYYGNNAVSHNLIMMNRRNCKNGNGFIFGTPGSGKSMSAKQEMMTVLLSSPDTVVVIDPEGEYYPMAEMLGEETGEVIRIAAGSDVHINPFDIDMDADSKDDPMAIKSDFIVSLCETAVAGQFGLAPTQRSIIDRCVRKVYEPYLSSRNPETGEYDKNKLPTLKDFYSYLRQQSGYDAMQLADSLEIYVTGSLDLFAYRTNVEYHKRFVVFDIKDVGATMKSMALLVVLDNIWNRIVSGRKEGRYTWFFIDEIYLLFKTPSSAEFLRNLYKRARKYYGLPTGITQNVSDLLEDDTARTMISNCEYIQMLNQAPLDRGQLAELLNISDSQLEFVTNSDPGQGLIYNGNVIVPFVNKLPKDTKEYQAMTTKPDEVKDREKRRLAAEAALAAEEQPDEDSEEE